MNFKSRNNKKNIIIIIKLKYDYISLTTATTLATNSIKYK